MALLIHNPPAKPVEEEWQSASNDENSNNGPVISSSAPPNSQLFVSPSKITIEKSSRSFLFSGPWPEIDYSEDLAPSSETPEAGSFRRFGLEDFTNLQDHMFELKLSESESSEEE